MGKLVGWIDHIDNGLIEGWAAASNPNGGYEASELSLRIDGTHIYYFTPTMHREDVQESGFGSGDFGFRINLSNVVPRGIAGQISIVDVDGRILPGLDLQPEDRLRYDSKRSKSTPSKRIKLSGLIYGETLNSEPPENGNLAIYVTYSRSGEVFDHHHKQVAELKAANFWVLVVHVSDEPTSLDALPVIGDALIVKVNIGYDFGSWWVGSQWLAEKYPFQMESAKALIITNDSCFGAISSPKIEAMAQSGEDLIGICDSYDHNYHLQSFFVCAGGAYLRSGAFIETLLSYTFPSKKTDVIRFGELLLSAEAASAGAKISAICPYNDLRSQWLRRLPEKIEIEKAIYKELGFSSTDVHNTVEASFLGYFKRLQSGECVNPTHIFWEEILDFGINLIKRELILTDPAGIPGRLTRMRRFFDSGLIGKDAYMIFAEQEKIKNLPIRI